MRVYPHQQQVRQNVQLATIRQRRFKSDLGFADAIDLCRPRRNSGFLTAGVSYTVTVRFHRSYIQVQLSLDHT